MCISKLKYHLIDETMAFPHIHLKFIYLAIHQMKPNSKFCIGRKKYIKNNTCSYRDIRSIVFSFKVILLETVFLLLARHCMRSGFKQ